MSSQPSQGKEESLNTRYMPPQLEAKLQAENISSSEINRLRSLIGVIEPTAKELEEIVNAPLKGPGHVYQRIQELTDQRNAEESEGGAKKKNRKVKNQNSGVNNPTNPTKPSVVGAKSDFVHILEGMETEAFLDAYESFTNSYKLNQDKAPPFSNAEYPYDEKIYERHKAFWNEYQKRDKG